MSIKSPGIDGKTVVAIGVLVVFVAAGVAGTATASGQSYGISIDQTEGERLTMTIVDSGNLDSLQLVAPSGTHSTRLGLGWELQAGSRITVRSNETVYEFFGDNNVTIPTTTQADGFVNITSPDDVPSQNLIFQDDDLTQNTSYDRRSAYLACLYEHPGFEINETVVPQRVSIPCHGPVLAQFDSIQAGTSKEIDNDTVTTPLILEEGEYNLLGTIDGECRARYTVSVGSGGSEADIQCRNPHSNSPPSLIGKIIAELVVAALFIMTTILVVVGLQEVLSE